MEIVKKIISCFEKGDIGYAKELVKVEPLILRSCPEQIIDNEEIVLMAMSRTLQAGINASHRIKEDIDFFIKAFNLNFGRPPIFLSSARDLLFMLEFARSYFNYRHEVKTDSVCKKFCLTSSEASVEVRSANNLVSKLWQENEWLIIDKENSINNLKSVAPKFEDFSYDYAFMWAFSNRSMREASEYR